MMREEEGESYSWQPLRHEAAVADKEDEGLRQGDRELCCSTCLRHSDGLLVSDVRHPMPPNDSESRAEGEGRSGDLQLSDRLQDRRRGRG